MNFTQFKSIMARLGVSPDSCHHDKDEGVYVCKRGELRITANSFSNKLTVTNLRTHVRFMTGEEVPV